MNSFRRPETISADLTWLGDRFEPGVEISIGADGRIESVRGGRGSGGGTHSRPGAGTRSKSGAATLSGGDRGVRHLRGAAILPGFVNAHSHAFQRGLRGLGESFPKGAGDFFSWREAMYALVERLTPESAYDLSRDAFEEMLDAGYTCVGEFHYVRHLGPERRFALDESVVHAAIDAGIRIVVLHTAYETGAIGRPLAGGQKRFETRGTTDYWRAHDRLGELIAGRSDASLGVVAHSVRAVPWETVKELRRGARERGQVFHMHVEEVVREVEECMAAYGRRPMRMIVDELAPDALFTAVHCTHTAPEDLARYGAAGATVCLCPNTEGNLGDGIADVPGMRRSGASIAIGTDLNSRISPFEELRWLEYVQRVARRQRGVIVDAGGYAAPALVEIGTAFGARSLGLETGRIQRGAFADFCVIDLAHPSLGGAAEGAVPGAGGARAGAGVLTAGRRAGEATPCLAAALVFGAGTEAVAGTCVAGRWRPRRGARSALLPGGVARELAR